MKRSVLIESVKPSFTFSVGHGAAEDAAVRVGNGIIEAALTFRGNFRHDFSRNSVAPKSDCAAIHKQKYRPARLYGKAAYWPALITLLMRACRRSVAE